ncbi:hypothetical protein [Mycoplasma todarodis]|nr:hypothetical protein [Mycoplasma todarodis]
MKKTNSEINNKTSKKIKFNYRYFLGFIAMVYIITYAFCDVYLVPLKEASGPAGSLMSPGTRPGIAQVYSFWDPWNEISLIFYFTIHSNIFVMVYMFLRSLGLIDPRKNKHAKVFQMIVAINIFVTFIVYWTILAPIDVIWLTPLKILNNFQLHFFTPLIMFVAFIFEVSRRKANEGNIKLKYKDLWYAMIFPIVWLIMAITLYYATRTTWVMQFKYSDGTWSPKFIYTFGIAIYPFLAFDIVPIWLPVVSLIAITALVFIVASLIITADNHNSWMYKLNDKVKSIFHKQRH